MPTTRRTAAPLAAVVAASIAAGCIAENNDRLVLGDPSRGAAVALPAVTTHDALTEAETVSVTSVDRSGWAPRIVVVPTDPALHGEHFTRLGPVLGDDRRAALLLPHPEAETAVQLDEPSQWPIVEGVAWPVWLVADALLALPRGIEAARTDGITQSPSLPYHRTGLDNERPTSP